MTVDIVVASGGGHSILASLVASTAEQAAAGNIQLPFPYSNTIASFPSYYRRNSFSRAALNGYNYLLHGAESFCPAVTDVQKYECCEAKYVKRNT